MPRLRVHRLPVDSRITIEQDTTTSNVARAKEACFRITYLLLAVLNAMIAENVMSIERVLAREKKIATPPVSHRTRTVQKGNSRQEIVISKSAPRQALMSTITRRQRTSSWTNDMLVACVSRYRRSPMYGDGKTRWCDYRAFVSWLNERCIIRLLRFLHRAWTMLMWDENRENGRWWIASAVCSLPRQRNYEIQIANRERNTNEITFLF